MQTIPSSQAARAMGVCAQPDVGSHVSVVHASPSSHCVGVVPAGKATWLQPVTTSHVSDRKSVV